MVICQNDLVKNLLVNPKILVNLLSMNEIQNDLKGDGSMMSKGFVKNEVPIKVKLKVKLTANVLKLKVK